MLGIIDRRQRGGLIDMAAGEIDQRVDRRDLLVRDVAERLRGAAVGLVKPAVDQLAGLRVEADVAERGRPVRGEIGNSVPAIRPMKAPIADPSTGIGISTVPI